MTAHLAWLILAGCGIVAVIVGLIVIYLRWRP